MMKFIASDVEAAKAKARRALGANAHIHNIRELPSGDVEGSASDKPGGRAAPGREPVRDYFDDDDGYARPRGSRLSEPLERKFAEDALSRTSRELSGESRSKGGGRGPARNGASAADRLAARYDDPVAHDLIETLAPHGVDERLLEALIDGARRSRIDDEFVELETAFAETFDFAPLRPTAQNPIMIVGPTGAGKTSCTAKLCAAAMARDGAAFIMTADVGRAGAIEQIRTYGDALGADYYIVETPQDVSEALRAVRPRGAVVLDTPGISPFDSGDIAALRSFQDAARAEPVLVLPASGDAAEWRDWAEAFATFGVRRMVITKFDATKRVGAGLSAAFAGDMTLANFSETPFISEGLLDASAEFLARRMLANRPGRVG
ncbi:MAG: hypothetical protein ACFB00_03345 [Parvularculaceae bacterium]